MKATVALVVVLAAGGCAHSSRPAATPSPSAAHNAAEDAFIGTTAAHLCNVQSAVYDDTKTLAAAYESPPAYPGISAEQVAAFQKRLITDPAFSARLTAQLKKACHPAAR